MRLAELSRRSGLPTPTIKYYLRLGVLHPGVTDSSTWASYDEAHVRRLRLVRALTDIGGLSLEEVAGVLVAVDEPGLPAHEVRGAAQWPLSPAAETPSASSRQRVDALLDRHAWHLDPASPHRDTLAAALDTLEDLDYPATDEVLDAYASAMLGVAEVEVARIARDQDPAVAAEHVVIGTVLYEPVLATLRRMAHEAVSGR